jgi:hypothetical protein
MKILHEMKVSEPMIWNILRFAIKKISFQLDSALLENTSAHKVTQWKAMAEVMYFVFDFEIHDFIQMIFRDRMIAECYMNLEDF